MLRTNYRLLITGTPLPLTDVIISPHDGAMYFAIGGRKVQSGLYRVTYTGKESTAPAKIPANPAAAQARAMRLSVIPAEMSLLIHESSASSIIGTDRRPASRWPAGTETTVGST